MTAMRAQVNLLAAKSGRSLIFDNYRIAGSGKSNFSVNMKLHNTGINRFRLSKGMLIDRIYKMRLQIAYAQADPVIPIRLVGRNFLRLFRWSHSGIHGSCMLPSFPGPWKHILPVHRSGYVGRELIFSRSHIPEYLP